MSESLLPSPRFGQAGKPKLYPAQRNQFGQSLKRAGFRLLDTSGLSEWWQGKLEVVWQMPLTDEGTTTCHEIRIFIPEAFPFEKPIVFPVDKEHAIRSSRHQSPGDDGALCLWTSDNNGWHPALSVEDLLERVRSWFIHYHQNDWPEQDRPPDLHLYFPSRSREGHSLMVISDAWHPSQDHTTGRFLVWQNSTRRAFAGVPTGGIKLPNPSTPPDRLLPFMGLNSHKPVQEGVWFRLKSEPKPYSKFWDLIEEIARISDQTPLEVREQLMSIYGAKALSPESRAIVALGYPGAEGKEVWLFLCIGLTDKLGNRKWSRRSYLNKAEVESFETALASKEMLVRRTRHTAKALSECKVTIFGQGAIGGCISVLLAKAGLLHLRLVDGDNIKPGNTVRHVVGLNWVGFKKTTAVSNLIHLHVPDCEISTTAETWDYNQLEEWVKDSDLVVDATANTVFSLLLNEICYRTKRTAVYVASYRRAAVGRIQIVRPGQDACLTCYENGHIENTAYPLIPPGDSSEYFQEVGCGVPTSEASAFDIENVANQATRGIIWVLQNKHDEYNHCLVVNDAVSNVSGSFPNKPGIHWGRWEPISGCVTCKA